MLRLPASPRARRRLMRWGALAALLLVGLVIAVAIPGKGSTPSGPLHYEGPAQLAAATPEGHLTAADRRAIDRMLDRFLPAGLSRRDPAVVWSLAGPELKASSTLSDWRRGDTPVPYYPPRETTFHDWSTIEVGKRYAVLNLLLHPKPPTTLGDHVFSIQVVKPKGEWLVNRIYTIAIMNPPVRPKTVTHEIGPADFAAPRPTSATPKNDKARLGRSALVPIISILALVLLIPLTLGGIALLRARRWRRRVRAEARTELPPLPSSYLSGPREEREKAGTRP